MTNLLETDFVEYDCDNGRKLKSGGTHGAPGCLVQGGLLDGRNRRLDGDFNQRLEQRRRLRGIQVQYRRTLGDDAAYESHTT